MKTAERLDQYLDTLANTPDAPPPPELDTATASFARILVRFHHAERPSRQTQDQMWEQVLASARATVALAPQNGQRATRHQPDAEDKHMQRTPAFSLRTVRQSFPPKYATWLKLAAAMMSIIVIGGFMIFNTQNNLPPLTVADLGPRQETNISVYRRFVNQAWNKGDMTALDNVLSASPCCHAFGMADYHGTGGVAQLITRYRDAFPDIHFRIEEVGAAGDSVWARLVGTGTQLNNLVMPNGEVIPATGNEVTLQALHLARFEDGRIAEIWIQSDNMCMMQQLQVAPSMNRIALEEANTQISTQIINEVWNLHQLDNFEALYAEAVNWHGARPFFSNTMSRSALKASLIAMQVAYPDLVITIDHTLTSNDMVAVHYSAQGTAYFGTVGRAANLFGDTETWKGVVIYRFDDGKVAEEWWYWDHN